MGETDIEIPNKTLKREEVWNLKRDELKPEVRNYADNLHGQIIDAFMKVGVDQFSEFMVKARAGELPRARVEGIGELIGRLGQVVEMGGTLFDEARFMLSLRSVVEEWEFLAAWHRTMTAEQQQDRRNKVLSIVGAVPLIVLVTDKYFLQRTLEKCDQFTAKQGPRPLPGESGILVSSILARSIIDNARSSLVPDVFQTVDLSVFIERELGLIDYLGTELPGGTLELKGMAGGGVGMRMKGGKIIAEEAERFVGDSMEGGEIEIERGGENLGRSMKGGRITVKRAGLGVGACMSGGEIHIQESCLGLGEGRKGGEIYFQGEKVG